MCQNKNPSPEFNSIHCKRVSRYGLHAMVFTLSMVDTIKSVANLAIFRGFLSDDVFFMASTEICSLWNSDHFFIES